MKKKVKRDLKKRISGTIYNILLYPFSFNLYPFLIQGANYV